MKTDNTDNESIGQEGMDITTEAHDILLALKAKESKFAYNVCFESDNESLMKCYSILGSRAIRNTMKSPLQEGSEVRSCIVRFLFDAVDYFGEHREIVAVTIDYLDRFLLTRLRHDNENIIPSILPNHNKMRPLDIFVLASLGLAIKLFSPCSGCKIRGEERREGAMLSKQSNGIIAHSHQHSFFVASQGDTEVYNGHEYDTLVQMAGGGEQTIKVLELAEENILKTLQWYVHPPTSFAFIHQIFQLVPSGQKLFSKSVQEMAYFQAELALSNQIVKPSIIAMSCVSNSFHRHLIASMPLINRKYESYTNSSLDIIKLLLCKMECSLEMSYEFDERIITMRGLLTNRLMECWRCKNEVDVDQKMISRSKEINQTNQNKVEMKSRSINQSDLDCHFLDNFDSLFSYPSMTKRNNEGQNQNKTQESELIVHYNKHIRPKLYRTNDEIPSSKSWPPTVHDSVGTTVYTATDTQQSSFFNLKDIESRLVKKLRQTHGHFFTKKV